MGEYDIERFSISREAFRELIAAAMERDLSTHGEVKVIQLIKIVRDTGLGLKEAKEFVESVGQSYGYLISKEVDCLTCKGKGYHLDYTWKRSPKF